MTTSSTPMATAIATAVAGGSAQPTGTGATGSADGASSGGGFTALLAAALGAGDPAAVVEALQGLGTDTSAGERTDDGDSPTGEVPQVAGLQQVLAALLPQLDTGSVPGGGAGGAAEADAVVGTGDGSEGSLDRAALLAALRTAATARRGPTPTTGEPAPGPDVRSVPAATPTTGATTPPGTITTAAGPDRAAAVAAAPTEGATPRVAPAAPTPGPAPATPGSAVPVDATVSAESAPPAPVAPAGTSGGAATGTSGAQAPPAPTPADGSLHARVVSRVIQAAELLENAPPPRRMVVEVPDGNGLRLQVAMRGSEVHVNLHAGRTAPDLGAWGRELAAGLASRGMSLGEFTSGDSSASGREQSAEHDHPRPSEDDRPSTRPSGRTRARDGDLRL